MGHDESNAFQILEVIVLDIKAQIIEAMMRYDRNEYTTKAFCEVFVELYYFESSGHRFFQGAEKCALDKLAFFAERYTECNDDLLEFPTYYRTEDEFRRVFYETKQLVISST